MSERPPEDGTTAVPGPTLVGNGVVVTAQTPESSDVAIAYRAVPTMHEHEIIRQQEQFQGWTVRIRPDEPAFLAYWIAADELYERLLALGLGGIGTWLLLARNARLGHDWLATACVDYRVDPPQI